MFSAQQQSQLRIKHRCADVAPSCANFPAPASSSAARPDVCARAEREPSSEGDSQLSRLRNFIGLNAIGMSTSMGMNAINSMRPPSGSNGSGGMVSRAETSTKATTPSTTAQQLARNPDEWGTSAWEQDWDPEDGLDEQQVERIADQAIDDFRASPGNDTPRDKWITPLLDFESVTGALDPDQGKWPSNAFRWNKQTVPHQCLCCCTTRVVSPASF